MEQEQPAQIISVYLKGYKSIRDLSVDLKQGLNIIIGANGSGKTNFMEFLDAAYRSDYAKLSYNQKFETDVKGVQYSIKIKGEEVPQINLKGKAYRIEEIKSFPSSELHTTYFLDKEKKVITATVEKSVGKSSPLVSDTLGTTTYVQYNNLMNTLLNDKLSLNLSCGLSKFFLSKEPATPNFLYSKLNTNSELFSFLDIIFFNYGEEFDNNKKILNIVNEIFDNKWFLLDALRGNLNQFSPIKDVKIDWGLARSTPRNDLDSAENATITGFEFQFFVNDEWISWNQLSDGTKRLFYIIGSVTYATNDAIILIEEPELGIHPHQLSTLMNFLKFQSAEKQIILTTHSPQVLNCLKATELDRIIVARHEGKTGTKMYHLSKEEQGFAAQYMTNEAFLSDYWLLSGFMNEETV